MPTVFSVGVNVSNSKAILLLGYPTPSFLVLVHPFRAKSVDAFCQGRKKPLLNITQTKGVRSIANSRSVGLTKRKALEPTRSTSVLKVWKRSQWCSNRNVKVIAKSSKDVAKRPRGRSRHTPTRKGGPNPKEFETVSVHLGYCEKPRSSLKRPYLRHENSTSDAYGERGETPY